MTQTIDLSSAFTVHRLSIREILEAIALLQQAAFIKLSKVRDNRVYLERYESFQEYCEVELKDFGCEYINQLLAAYENLPSADATQYTEVAGGV